MNGHVLQVGSTGSIHFNAVKTAPVAERDGPRAAQGRNGGGCGWVVAVAVALLIFVLLSQCSGGSVFPAESEPWPEGVGRDEVLSTALDGLRSCSRAVVLRPVNCPQSEEFVGSGAGNVEWRLRGDPMDGARVAYEDGKFLVSGSAVMTVSYDHPSVRSEFTTKIVPYLAEVSSSGAELLSLESVDPAWTPPVFKKRPEMRQGEVTAVLRSAFERCAASTGSEMDSGCPDARVVAAQRDGAVEWGFAGDPAINTRVTFDRGSGLISVVGSYAATANYVDIFGEQEVSSSGTYWAKVMAESGGLVVLEIETCDLECSE